VEIITRHAKAIAAVLGAVLAAVIPILATDQPLDFVAWVNIVILAAGAIQVYSATNTTTWPYAKLIAAAVSTGAVTTLTVLADGPITRGGWVQIAVAFLAAFATYRLPNTTAAVSTGRHQKTA
jgi:hypothetical protein